MPNNSKLLYFQVSYKTKNRDKIVIPEFESDLAALSEKYGLDFVKIHTVPDKLDEYERHVTYHCVEYKP